MKIDQLPVEILTEIFSYLPPYVEVSLTNSLFYNIMCVINDPSIRIDPEFCDRFLRNDAKSSKRLQNVLTSSKRKISTIEIKSVRLSWDPDLRRVVLIFEKYSANITSLKMVNIKLEESIFVRIFALIPNVEHLELNNLSTYRRSYLDECEWDCVDSEYCNEDYNLESIPKLRKLQSLVIDHCYSDELVRLFTYLPVGVLRELKINFWRFNNWILVTEVLDRQLNIKNLNLAFPESRTYYNELDVFDNLKLESLQLDLYLPASATIATILSKQTKLKSLNLYELYGRGTPVDAIVMHAIAQLLELESLTMDVTETPNASFAHIRNLKNLKDLTLKCGGSTVSISKIKILSELDNASIKKLMLIGWHHHGFLDDLLGTLAKSTPHLTNFRCKDMNVSDEALDSLMRHFNFVEILETSIGCFVNSGKYFNPKLRELSIRLISIRCTDKFYKTWLPELISVYPNLRKFRVYFKTWSDHFTFKIKPILNGFAKLETLLIDLTLESYRMTLNVADLDCLLNLNHHHHLKFVSLGNVCGITDDQLGKMRKNFKIIRNRNFRPLEMAVDRYAIQRESTLFNAEKYHY